MPRGRPAPYQLLRRQKLRLTIILLLAAVVVARAEGPDSTSQGQTQTGSSKEPPAPIFPKHRRGPYRNGQGLELIDATPQSPPLDTDDPSVPDNGEYEINLTTHADLSKAVQNFDLLFVDANYGMVLRLAGHELPTQLKFECPLAAVKKEGNPSTVGVGAAAFGLKFNFFTNEHKGVSVSGYPQVQFGTPGARSVQNGLADPGQTLMLPLLVSKELKYVTFVANVSLNKPLHDREREMTVTTGVAIGRAITRKVATMVEVRTESSLDLRRDNLIVFTGGVIHGVRNIILYAQAGRSLLSDDGFGHVYVGAGMKVFIHAKDRPH